MLIILGVLVVLVLAGCGNECEVDTECSASKCFSASCIEGSCVEEPLANCCGNGIVDSNENECSCPRDAGECKGKVGKYLEKFCRNPGDTCSSDIKDEKINAVTLTHTKDVTGFEINVKTTFDKPFNVDKSMFEVEIELIELKQNIFEPKITKIELFNKKGGQIIGEANNLDRNLWKTGYTFDVPVNVIYDFNDHEEEVNVHIKIYYEYKEVRKGETKTKPGFYEKLLVNDLVFVDPDKELSCNARVDCNDFNECSIDNCVDGTALCRHDYVPGCCGNFQCEGEEDKANCPGDCGPCEGALSENLEYRLKGNQCTVERTKSQQQIKTKTKSFSFFTVSVKSTFTSPLDINLDNMEVEFSLDNVQLNSVKLPLTITRIQVLDKDVLLGEKQENIRLNSQGDVKQATVPILYDLEGFEEERDVTLKIDYSYNQVKSDNTLDQKSGSFEIDVADDIVFVSTSENE